MKVHSEWFESFIYYEGHRVKGAVTRVKCDPDNPDLSENMTTTAVTVSPFHALAICEPGSAGHTALHVRCWHSILLFRRWPAGVQTSHFSIRR